MRAEKPQQCGAAASDELPPAAAQNASSRAARPTRFLVMFCVLALLFALGQFHRSSGGVLSTTFSAEFALSPDRLGLVIGILFFAQGLGQIPAGVLLDRFGTRLSLPLVALCAVFGCFLVAFATGWIALSVGRMMIGFGFSAAMMGGISILSYWVPPAALSTMTGRLLFVGMLGGVFATSPFTYMIENYGWRTTYAGLGILTAITAGVAALVVRDKPPHAVAAQRRPETLIECLNGSFMVLSNRRLRPILAVAPILYSPGQILLGLWAAPYLKDVHGVDATMRGYALAAMVVAMSVGVLLYGPIERRVNARRPVVIGGALCVCAAFLGLAIVGGWSPLLAAALCVTAILSSMFFIIVLAHAQSLFPLEYAGRVVATIGLLSISGIFCAQYLTALLLTAFPGPAGSTAAESGYRLVFLVMAALYLCVALVYWKLDETPR